MSGWLPFALVIALAVGVLLGSLEFFRRAAKPLSRWTSTRTGTVREVTYSPRRIRAMWAVSLLELGFGAFELWSGRVSSAVFLIAQSAYVGGTAYSAAKRATQRS
ncbi:MAG: hypothetical protein M0Z87_05265 [Actinomycetota bacterium]|nr:hypothetical protein [Actinomycetota bacterium]